MTEKEITVTVNGTERELGVEPRRLLVHALREDLDLTGTHIGCDTGNCGACTVVRDGEAVKSCLMFAVQADGSELLTVEGMMDLPEAGEDLHPIQEGFTVEHGLQCGFCTPGMIMASKALLDENPAPTEAEIRENISGNLCRCTGYQNIVKSIQYAADELADGDAAPAEADAEAATDGGLETDGELETDGGYGCGAGCGCAAGGTDDTAPGGGRDE